MGPAPREPGAPAVGVLARISWPAGRPSVETAERLGTLLASNGYTVVSTGYGALAGAVSRGAALAGGRAVGYPVRTWPLEPSPWLTEVRWVPDSYAQCLALGACPALVAVAPGAGSLAEVAFAWQLGGRRARLVLLGAEWDHWLAACWRWLVPRRGDLAGIAVEDDPAGVIARLAAALRPAPTSWRP